MGTGGASSEADAVICGSGFKLELIALTLGFLSSNGTGSRGFFSNAFGSVLSQVLAVPAASLSPVCLPVIVICAQGDEGDHCWLQHLVPLRELWQHYGQLRVATGGLHSAASELRMNNCCPSRERHQSFA